MRHERFVQAEQQPGDGWTGGRGRGTDKRQVAATYNPSIDKGLRTTRALLTRVPQVRILPGAPVRRFLHPLRASATAAQAPSSAPTILEVTQWITRRPDRLGPDEQAEPPPSEPATLNPRLNAAAVRVAAFAQLMTALTGTAENPHAWLSAVDADDLPGLHFFTHGIRRDLDAVTPRGDTVLTRSGPRTGSGGRRRTRPNPATGVAPPDAARSCRAQPAGETVVQEGALAPVSRLSRRGTGRPGRPRGSSRPW